MKIAILSDFHLGYERFREDAYRQAEEALTAAASLADMLLLPGDLFDSRAPRTEILAEAINLFRNAHGHAWKARIESVQSDSKAYTDAPVITIPGTHERRAQKMENPVTLLALAGLLVDVSDGFAVVEKDGERVAVYGIGGVAEDKFLDTVNSMSFTPQKGCFNVFMFHQSIHELLPFDSGCAHFDDLPKGFDLYIDGHIHSRTEAKVHGKPFLIPGSTVLTQLKEGEQEEKGFYIYDTNTNAFSFNKIHSRRLVVVKIDGSGKAPEEISREIRKKIDEVIKGAEGKPIVKIELKGRLGSGFKNADLDVAGIAKGYGDSAFVEITKSGIEDIGADAGVSSLRSGSLENMSVKDYGLSIFLEKLRQSKYELDISPTELFEILSSEANKDKAVKRALESLFPDK